MLTIEDLLAIFAQSEEQQAQYFPMFEHPVFASDGVFEVQTSHARMIALCCLERKARHAEVAGGEYGDLCGEISGLAHLVIESSGLWEWLVWHPSVIWANNDGAIDSSLYQVWAVIRRLCRAAMQLRPTTAKPRRFAELFAAFISTGTENSAT